MSRLEEYIFQADAGIECVFLADARNSSFVRRVVERVLLSMNAQLDWHLKHGFREGAD